MVKLKLDAIKGGLKQQPENKIVAQKVPDPTQAPIIAQKKISLGQIKVENNQPITEDIKKDIPAKTPGTIIQQNTGKVMTARAGNKISLGGIKKPKKTAAIIPEAYQEPEVFPIGASCELQNIELFPAYTSKFKKKQGSLLQEIKKLKRLPKTNKFFIFSLIGATIGGISLLFILAPEKHNLNYYKTSLLESYTQIQQKISSNTSTPPIQISEDNTIINDNDAIIIDENDSGNENISSGNDSIDQDISNIDKSPEYYLRVKQQILGIEIIQEDENNTGTGELSQPDTNNSGAIDMSDSIQENSDMNDELDSTNQSDVQASGSGVFIDEFGDEFPSISNDLDI